MTSAGYYARALYRMFKSRGFTLIEIMIAVGILAILSGITLSVLNGASFQEKGRDSQRIGDLKRIQTALELSFADNRTYPTAATPIWAENISGLSSYLSPVPDDPLEPDEHYWYTSDGSSYSLYAQMEVASSNVKCEAQIGCGSAHFTHCCKFTNP